MKNITFLSLFAALISFTTASADDLALFGLSSIEPLTGQQAETVRGQGLDSISMASLQIFAFDPVSGSSINLQANSVNSNNDMQITGYDIEPLASSRSNVGIGGFDLAIDDFIFSTTDINVGATGAGFFLINNLFDMNFDADIE
ncbi:MAG: hypothetical protein L7U72_02310 [Rubripirellula sp.]|nr:hypothetical protein [Rubripirellula sp.]